MKCGSYGLASVNCRSHRSCCCSPLSHPFGSPLFPSPSPLLDTHHQDGSSGERPSPSPPRARPGCLLCVCHDEVLAAPRIHWLQLLQGRLIFPPPSLSLLQIQIHTGMLVGCACRSGGQLRWGCISGDADLQGCAARPWWRLARVWACPSLAPRSHWQPRTRVVLRISRDNYRHNFQGRFHLPSSPFFSYVCWIALHHILKSVNL